MEKRLILSCSSRENSPSWQERYDRNQGQFVERTRSQHGYIVSALRKPCVNRKKGQNIKLQGFLHPVRLHLLKGPPPFHHAQKLGTNGSNLQASEDIWYSKHITWFHCSHGSGHTAGSLFTTHSITPCNSNKHCWEHTVFHLRLFYDYESQSIWDCFVAVNHSV